MTRFVHCKKLNKELEGLDFAPFPGSIGKNIYESISKEAWEMWLNHQVMLINEYRLNMMDQKAREYLQEQLQKFLFEENAADQPAGFIPPSE